MITNYVQQIKYAKLGREICEILRNRMFEKLCKTNYKFWCENRVGDIITILDTDVSLVEKILTSIISCGILNILYFSGIIMVLLLCNVKTGFLITILVFLFVLLQKKNGKKVKRGMSELREKIGWFNSETQEMIHNMPDIQLIYPEKDLVNSYMQQNRLTNMSYIQQTKNMLEAKNIGWGFNILSIFSVLLIGGYAVLREDISVGILFSMIVYVQQLYSPAVALGETYNSIKNAQPSILRISTLLENKEMAEEADFCPEGSLKGNIIFKNVTFSYAQNTDPVFRNLNLSLKAGRIYGITGDNGMGKSTFIRLIAGLCMPDSGNIYIDDIEIKKYNVEYLSLDELLAQSDIVSLHLAVTPQTVNTVDSKFISKMKKDAFLINTSRGDLVDNDALKNALLNGEIAGAGLDVYTPEPLLKDNTLLDERLKNKLILTPHIAGITDFTVEKIYKNIAENTQNIILKKELKNRVN